MRQFMMTVAAAAQLRMIANDTKDQARRPKHRLCPRKGREMPMRRLLISLRLVCSASLGTPATSSAQYAVSQYPWCWEHKGGGARSCYYATWEQCNLEAFYRGGFCIPSPYYRQQPAVRSRGHRHD
jgi:hypothetical protein